MSAAAPQLFAEEVPISNSGLSLAPRPPAFVALTAGFQFSDEGQFRPTLAADSAAVFGGAPADWQAAPQFEARLNGRTVFLDEGATLGDATLLGEFHAAFAASKDLQLTFDAAYAFDRDYDGEFSPFFAAIDTTHAPSVALGLEWETDFLRVNLDGELRGLIHNDLERIGFSPFDRSARDYGEDETALRLTMLRDGSVFEPFVEIAFVDRFYISDASRDVSGPDFIAGFSFDQPGFTGQAGAIYAWRDLANGGRTQVIGPYVDLSWRVNPATLVSFAVASQIDQESSGDPRPYRVHAMTTSVERRINDEVTVKGQLEAVLEDNFGEPSTLTLTPQLSASWAITERMTWLGTVTGEYEASGDEKTSTFSVSTGLRVILH